jgi:WD40 repeat protein/DNA-binding SARP family transcriptional activator
VSSPSPQALLEVAADRAALAAILDARGRHREAQEPLRQALSILESVLGPDHYEVAVTLDTLGAIARRAGDSAGAVAAYERALGIKRRVLGGGHSDVAVTLNELGALYLEADRFEEAEAALSRALAILERASERTDPELAACRENREQAPDPEPAVSALEDESGPRIGSAPARGVANMHVHLLGPVEVVSDRGTMPLGGPKPRALLAMLALEVGSTVSLDRLIDGLWGDDPPSTAPKMVQLYVSHLRKAMAECGENGAIATRGRGYALQVSRDRVDAARFERLLAQGAAREALRLWHGPALADVAGEPFAAAEIRRLDELRTAALETAIDQDLDAGRHREVLPELESLLAQEPLRERLHAQRMLALYRSGRQADALDAYRQARTTLVEQIGVEPGPDLRRLHDAILRQDPSLDPSAQELPSELSGWTGSRTPLLGRDADLERLRRLWGRALDGAGAGVVVTGALGMGKTRLALELARDVRRDHGDVLYCDCGAEPSAALQALADARAVQRPTLLVLDDLDHAGEEVHGALHELISVLPELPLLALATSAHAVAVPTGETLALEPLAREDVAALARFHTGARADADVPVDRLVAESGGVPALVHQAAAEWAKAQAMRRLREAAARTSAERAGWHLAEDDLVAGVVELQGLRERADVAGAQPGLPPCPFKGLAPFETGDAEVFFGRERLVADMVARLPGTRLMGVIGPSGSGKSSAMRAGLLAALADGVLPGSAGWPVALIRPGQHPLHTLERAIAALEPRDRWVVAVDQFEEAFTACRDEGERAAFVDALVRCARNSQPGAVVIIACRADFYGHCAGYPELSRMLGANQVLVGPMRRHELRRAIEQPALRAGLRVEPDLVDALIADVEGEPGGLPLLSTALLELWQQRDGRRLHLGAYDRTGGVRGAVARLAEASYERLALDQREQARRIMLRLAGEGDVRERVPVAELDGARGAEVLSVLASDRLITLGEGEAEVAHEALLREWPRLRGWLEEDAEGRRLHRHLTHAARDWDAAARDPSELYRGSRLASALEWVDAHEEELSELEREFIAAGRAAAEVEAERQRRANRRLRALLAGVATLLALAVVAGAVAVSQRGEAREAALVADAQRLGAQALTNDRLDEALLLASAGVELDASAATLGSLNAVLLRDPSVLGELRGDGWRLYSVALSPDGRLAAIGDERGGVTVYDTATRKRLSTPYRAPEGLVQHLAFSPDGATLALTVHGEKTLVDLIDPRTGKRKLRFELPPFPGEPFYVLAPVVFQPNGRDLVVQQTDVAFPDAPASVLWRLNAQTGAVERPSLRVGRHGAWNLVTTADRERLFVTSPGDDATYEIAPETLELRRTYPVGDHAGAVSADGRMFALGSQRGDVRLLDLQTGRVRRFEGRLDGSNMRMAFTPDGRTLVTSDDTGKVSAWDVERGRIREQFAGHTGEPALAVSGDGRTLYSAALDARMIIWDLAGDRRLDRRFPAGPAMTYEDASPKGLALSPDGRTLAITQLDGTVDLVDASALEGRRRLRVLRGAALAVDFSPDGRLLAVTGEGGRVTLWDARTLSPAGELRGLEGFTYSQAIAFSPDGRLVAAGGIGDGKRGGVRVWDVRTGEQAPIEFGVPAPSLAFSPDGRLLAAAGIESPGEVRDVRSGRLVTTLETGDFSRSVAFSPDGSLLAVGHYGGTATLLSTRSWKPVGRRLEGHRARLTALEFSLDGRLLATGSADGTVLLWDVRTQRPVGSSLTIEPDKYVAATFATDGSHLFAVPHEGRAVRWDIRAEAWQRHACLVAGRELTAREWRDALPDRPFRRVCPRR